jgi:hypothetical protein
MALALLLQSMISNEVPASNTTKPGPIHQTSRLVLP